MSHRHNLSGCIRDPENPENPEFGELNPENPESPEKACFLGQTLKNTNLRYQKKIVRIIVFVFVSEV